MPEFPNLEGNPNGRSTATRRAARKWATVGSGPTANKPGNAGSRPSSSFWRSREEEAAYLAGFIAGQAYEQVKAEGVEGYTEATPGSRKGKGHA